MSDTVDGGNATLPPGFVFEVRPESPQLGTPFVLEVRVAHPRDERYELRPPPAAPVTGSS